MGIIQEELIQDVKLNPAVINVLIDFTLRTNNNKLVKSYIETIAGQWKRSGIETASEAMDIAEKEYKKQYNKVQSKKTKVVPSWYNKDIVSEESSKEEDEEFKNFIEEFRK